MNSAQKGVAEKIADRFLYREGASLYVGDRDHVDDREFRRCIYGDHGFQAEDTLHKTLRIIIAQELNSVGLLRQLIEIERKNKDERNQVDQ